MARYTFTHDQRRRGGLNASSKIVNQTCPECGKNFEKHSQYAGHLGLHAFARNNNLTYDEAKRIFSLMGAAVTDPFPGNGAFYIGHEMLRKYRQEG